MRQFRFSRKAVVTLITLALLVVVYAGIETILFWMVARRAAQVEPLKRRIQELESSSEQLARLSSELTRLKAFEQQLRRALSGREAGALEGLPWDDAPSTRMTRPERREPASVAPRSAAPPISAEARGVGSLAYTAMDVPTMPPVRGYVTRRFVTPQTVHQVSHRGLDIAAPEGTPVLAAADGLVLFSDWTYRYGNLVVLAHRSGYVTFYGHNQVLFARPGQRVRQGEPVALVGNSGISTAPHLHFELWQDGSPVDPMALLKVAP